MNKRIFLRVVLAVWVIIWLVFLIRPYFKKGLLGEYSSLIRLSTEEKRAYVTGRDLYDFIKFCKESTKEPSTYRIAGLEKDSVEHRRFRYYLYPCVEISDPEYIFVYKVKDFPRDGYKVYGRMNPETYILRKIN